MGWDGYGAQELATHGFGRLRSGGRKRRTKRASGSCKGCSGRKRRKAKTTRRSRSSSPRSSSLSRARARLKSGKRLVKGSAEAKAYMAAIRKKRK